MIPGFVLAALAASTAFFLAKSIRNYRALPALEPLPGGSGDVTVIIPARNEAHQIERCIRSFTCPVIVVDDGSTDGTAEIAARAGARVIPAPPLQSGELGKPNACAAGARQAITRWILFVDADTWYSPEFAQHAVAYAEREHLQLLSAFLRQDRQSWAERAILPYAFALYFCGVSAKNVNSPDSPEALANGQCLLAEAAAYREIGGHDAVKCSVIEDVALARLAKQRGLRTRVIRAEQYGSVRMYDSLQSIWRGLEKNSFRFLQVNPWTGLQVIAASIVITSWLPALLLGVWSVPFLLLIGLGLLPWYGRLRELGFAPFGIYLFQLIALTGMVKTLAGVKSLWKARYV